MHNAEGKLERRIEELELQLATLNDELETVLYSISHDLRAPLMAIGGFTDLLLEQPTGLDETRLRYLQRIREGNTRLTKLLDGLLRLSRVGRQPLTRQTLDLANIARTSFRKLHESVPGRTIVFDAPATLPATGDLQLIQVLLDAVVENAWKSTANVFDARITVGSLVQGQEPTYFVRDNGVGFEMRYVEKLFKPLQRLHTERQFPGIGIGLALAAKIVQRHGGRIWAEAQPELGATFYFTLGTA